MFRALRASPMRCAGIFRRSGLLIFLFASQAAAQTLTLEAAMRIAAAANPALRAAAAEMYAAQGQATESGYALWNNPSVSLDGTRRALPQAGAPEQRVREWGFGLAQTFEVAGQQGFRRQAANAELEAVRANVAEFRSQLAADVADRFIRLLAVQLRIAAEHENLRLVEEAAAAIGKRVAAGETSKLQGNVSSVEAERARNQLAQLDEAMIQARADLASLLQLPPNAHPVAAGSLTSAARYGRESLLESARRRRVLAVLALRENAAQNRLALERAAARPDVTLGVNMGREGLPGLRESTLGVAVSVPLPLFRKNESGIGRALTGLEQARVERERVTREVRAAVLAQWDRVENLRAREARLAAKVLPLLEDNLRLSKRAFEEGEIGLSDLLLVNRQVVDARREMLEAQTDLRLAQVALERSAGWDFESAGTKKDGTQ